MRVVAFLHVPRSPFGAISLGYDRVRVALEGRGHSLDIITPDDIRWLRYVHWRARVILYPWAVAAWLRRRRARYDLAVFQSYAGWVMHACCKGRLRTITAFHGLEPLEYEALVEEARRQRRPLTLRYRAVYGARMNLMLSSTCRRSDAVLCLNSAEADRLVDRGWTTADRITVVTHGVPAEGFFPERVHRRRARRVMLVSQWLDRKGVRYIADAFTTLIREGLDLELWCVGTRTPTATVLAAFAPDVAARVHNFEALPNSEVLAQYREADIFVHAALMEGLSRAQAEAMASGLPIVTTRSGAVGIDMLADGESGLVVPMRDAAALADAIRRLADDHSLRERLGRAAYRIAADRLDYQKCIGGLLDTYERVAG